MTFHFLRGQEIMSSTWDILYRLLTTACVIRRMSHSYCSVTYHSLCDQENESFPVDTLYRWLTTACVIRRVSHSQWTHCTDYLRQPVWSGEWVIPSGHIVQITYHSLCGQENESFPVDTLYRLLTTACVIRRMSPSQWTHCTDYLPQPVWSGEWVLPSGHTAEITSHSLCDQENELSQWTHCTDYLRQPVWSGEWVFPSGHIVQMTYHSLCDQESESFPVDTLYRLLTTACVIRRMSHSQWTHCTDYLPQPVWSGEWVLPSGHIVQITYHSLCDQENESFPVDTLYRLLTTACVIRRMSHSQWTHCRNYFPQSVWSGEWVIPVDTLYRLLTTACVIRRMSPSQWTHCTDVLTTACVIRRMSHSYFSITYHSLCNQENESSQWTHCTDVLTTACVIRRMSHSQWTHGTDYLWQPVWSGEWVIPSGYTAEITSHSLCNQENESSQWTHCTDYLP